MHLDRSVFLVSQTKVDKEKALNYQKRSLIRNKYESVHLFLYIKISTYTIFHSIKVIETLEK